jgi:hypothetical protein
MLNRVTFTGADDSVDPARLVQISHAYPWVEWGILFSQSQQGRTRFPSEPWLDRLSDAIRAAKLTRPMRLSAHLCGGWVRDAVLRGNFSWEREYDDIRALFDRVQFNFHGKFHEADAGFGIVLRDGVRAGRNYIFQCDGVNDDTVAMYCQMLPDACSPLFDRSGGAGILPVQWPEPWTNLYCGYAGGIGPETVEMVVEELETLVPQPYWIDMERRVRSEDDVEFMIEKVQDVLDAVDRMVSRQPTGGIR